MSTRDTEIDAQVRFWNDWNTGRERRLLDVSEDQSAVVLGWLRALNRTGLDILEVGCGAGWMSGRLQRFGSVTAVDLAHEIVTRAQARFPRVRFIAGNFMRLPLRKSSYDVIVTLEVLPHVADQRAFVNRLSELLKPGGLLMLGTQNGWVLERCQWVTPQGPGQIRRWTDRRQLARLLTPRFTVKEMFTITPDGDRGMLRIVNSVKLNDLLSRLASARRIRRVKERAGCGRTIMAYAVNRAH